MPHRGKLFNWAFVRFFFPFNKDKETKHFAKLNTEQTSNSSLSGLPQRFQRTARWPGSTFPPSPQPARSCPGRPDKPLTGWPGGEKGHGAQREMDNLV